MMVTFVSQCEKKALPKTRRVLDAFANRIGDRTWQTVITNEGLLAVKKLLRRTASKNTAVSCHWIRSRNRTELIWVVGNRRKFNIEGHVPVNLTSTEADKNIDNYNWKTHNLITHAATIAGLFHDFGKANQLFQDKINPSIKTDKFEPYRHEWVSLRLFQAFIGKQSDAEWLDSLANGNLDNISNLFRDGLDDEESETHPILSLQPFAQLVAWIIVSHHRLPLVPIWQKKTNGSADINDIDHWLEKHFEAIWNSYRCKEASQKNRLENNWAFAEGALPHNSKKWLSHAIQLASSAKKDLLVYLDTEKIDFINDQLFTSHLARLSMMLADHYYSAQAEVTEEWRSNNYQFYANTFRKSERHYGAGYKQQLDEHLIGVAHNAREITNALPKLNTSLPSLLNNDFLSKPVKGKDDIDKYGWQNTAVEFVKKLNKEPMENGFFGINMASTGAGKTIANAKIMYTLGQLTGRTRFSVALGLRTLTLQTGKALREDLGLKENELALAIGSTAVKQLFASKNNEVHRNSDEFSGSTSSEEFLNPELRVDYNGDTTHSLSNWTKHDKSKRIDKLLCAPVLVSTIDHLVPATEGTKGGKQIAPMLRLMTSDLILDEPDDFGLSDLPALCRLVYWAGMLGSKVLLSTATMPPALAIALFESYRAGWSQYAKANLATWNNHICCAWFDEFSTSAYKKRMISDYSIFKEQHKAFANKRVNALKEEQTKTPPKRIGEIISIEADKDNHIDNLALTINKALIELHQHHAINKDSQTLSVGLVRMANINPLVAVARSLLLMDAPEDTCIHYCIYHSRYPLAIRSHIENKLDAILNRKDETSIWDSQEGVGAILENHQEKNHIFVVLASPVAEVGRDHDYDWAIVEPSSMRSIIQLAGRVHRHRTLKNPHTHPNILLLNKNLKTLKGKEVCFDKPGFEIKKELLLAKHELSDILSPEEYKPINSTPRISNIYPIDPSPEGKYTSLNELEHKALEWQLFSGTQKASPWWANKPHWCGELQRQQRFRSSNNDEPYYLFIKDEDEHQWKWLNTHVYPHKMTSELTSIEINEIEISKGKNSRFWFKLDALEIYTKLADEFSIDLKEACKRYGELRITEYQNSSLTEYYYHSNLGLFQEIGSQ